MSDELTKGEILAMLEVQKEAATQMQKVASSLSEMTKTQEKIIDKLESIDKTFVNGLPDRIGVKVGEQIVMVVAPFEGRQKLILKQVEEANRNTNWLKIILGGATLVILIATVVVNVMNRAPVLTPETVRAIIESHQQIVGGRNE